MKQNHVRSAKFFQCCKSLLVAASLIACASAAQAQVQMDGNIRFTIYGSHVRVYIEELENLSAKATGPLRLVVWASEDQWGEPGRGHLLGFSLLPRLAPFRQREDFVRTMTLHRPSTDRYYVTILLQERAVDENGKVRWQIRDWNESDNRVLITGKPFPFFPWD